MCSSQVSLTASGIYFIYLFNLFIYANGHRPYFSPFGRTSSSVTSACRRAATESCTSKVSNTCAPRRGNVSHFSLICRSGKIYLLISAINTLLLIGDGEGLGS